MSIKGLDSFEAVLTLIKDPDGFKNKLKEIKDATDKYQVVVESVVELSKVNDYTKTIASREEESKSKLEAATREASAITAKAQSDAVAVKEQSKKQKEKLDERDRSIASREELLAKRESEVQAARGEVEGLLVANKAKSLELDQLLLEVAERKAKLLEALK